VDIVVVGVGWGLRGLMQSTDEAIGRVIHGGIGTRLFNPAR